MNNYTTYDEAYDAMQWGKDFPNTAQIRSQATRVVRGPIPAPVRKELALAVKLGLLGRLKKDGLRPEVFYHPDHKNGAKEMQDREQAYGLKCIAGAVVRGVDYWEAHGGTDAPSPGLVSKGE